MSEQTVVESTEEQSPQTEPEVENAQEESLDSLLKEYETQEEPAKPEPKAPAVDPDTVSRIEDFMARQEQREMQSALDEAANSVKAAAGDIAVNLPDYLMVGALRNEAANNPAIEKAFNDRMRNPEGWGKIVKALGKKIANDLTPNDKQSTESWRAVESAVHSASTSKNTTDELPDFNRMTDQEFMQWKMKNG